MSFFVVNYLLRQFFSFCSFSFLLETTTLLSVRHIPTIYLVIIYLLKLILLTINFQLLSTEILLKNRRKIKEKTEVTVCFFRSFFGIVSQIKNKGEVNSCLENS